MAKVVILGAGLTGLSTSYHLEKNKVFDCKIFEKNKEPGGLCRSVTKNGFTFDYTGHLLHVNDPYFKSFLEEIIGLENFNLINRKSFIYSHKTYTAYPFQTNLFGLPHEVISECIEGFVKRNTSTRLPGNMHEWVLKYFGKGLGKHFFFPYNKKLWCLDAKEQHPSWTQNFVPSTSLREMIKGAVQKREIDGKGYNSNFFYPKSGGISLLPNQLAKKIQTPIAYGYEAEQINLKERYVRFSNGHIERFEHLVSTLPLNTLLTLLCETTDLSLVNQAKKLRCNAVVNFNLGLSIPNLTDKHWIYFPETSYKFYRVGFWNNFSSSMAPQGCSSLYGEFSYVPNIMTSKAWLEKTTHHSIKQILEILGASSKEIVTEHILNLPHAYVMYDSWRERNLPKILSHLAAQSISSIGRYGAWKYSSMQDAILDGKQEAEKLAKNRIKQFSAATKTTFDEDPSSQKPDNSREKTALHK